MPSPNKLETWNDQHPTQDRGAVDTRNQIASNERRGLANNGQPDNLAALVMNAANIIHTASRLDPIRAGGALDDRTTWHATIQTARRVLAVEHAAPQIEHDLGLEL